VLAILLPLFAAANIFFTPVLTRFFVASSRYKQLLLPALHILQGGLAIIIATLSSQGFQTGWLQKCALRGNWQQLVHNHNGPAIERIQNTFDCCGYHSVADMEWPKGRCEEIYNRHTGCEVPWRQAMHRTSGLEFAVAVVVGIIQVSQLLCTSHRVYIFEFPLCEKLANWGKLAHLVYLRQRGAKGSSTRDARGNGTRDFRRLPQPVEAEDSERLVEDGVEAYHDSDEEGHIERPSLTYPPSGNAEDGPRVAPSGLGRDEANEWRS
jgi:hypothetical protein